MGRRIVRLLGDRTRIFAMVRASEQAAPLRALGAVPLVADLDRAWTLDRLRGIAPVAIHLAPPPSHGAVDTRTRALLPVLSGVRTLVYVSTSGVYGDRGDAWVDETEAPTPSTDRARRRVDAERRLRGWARTRGARLIVLRVPGIYAGDRLPVARLAAGTPVLASYDDVYTNHVHADDLARAIVIAIRRGAPQRIYHAVDDSAIRMGDWFDLVADAHGLPRPERLSREDIASRIAPRLLSFMRESRRLSNARMKNELGLRLAYPTVRDGIAAALRTDVGRA